jgi:hypothetical protein
VLADLDAWFESADVPDDDALFEALASPGGVRFGMVGSGRRKLLTLRDGVDLPD